MGTGDAVQFGPIRRFVAREEEAELEERREAQAGEQQSGSAALVDRFVAVVAVG